MKPQKKCSACGQVKETDLFYKKAGGAIFRSECKECTKAMGRRDYHKNQPQRRHVARKYHFKNREAIIGKMRKYRANVLLNNPVQRLMYSCRASAKAKGLDFTIKAQDIVIPLVCPVLGIPILECMGRPGPSSPSVDRIDNSKGYVPGNIVVVSYRANILKRDATKEELRRISEFYSKY